MRPRRSSPTIERRTVVEVNIPADKWRPGVVLDVYEASALIAMGTSQDHGLPGVTITPQSPDGRILGLTATTYFVERGVFEVPLSKVRLRKAALGPARPQLIADLAALVTR
jgi:hypothetical protein